MVRLRVTCCSTVTRAAAFCSEPVEPTPARPGSTRKRVMPNKRSSRPPSWLEMASERIAEAPAVPLCVVPPLRVVASALGQTTAERSEEHTSELQSLAYLVCRLLLERKETDTDLRKNRDADLYYF